MKADLQFHLIQQADEKALAPIERGLHEYNLAQLGAETLAQYHKLAVVAKDKGGETIGGIWAEIFWEWLYIRTLWVAEDFRGRFTLATCMLLPVETQETCRFELRGDGSRAGVLALNNQFWVHKPGTSTETVWMNRTAPPARGGLVGCNINTNNKEAAPKGFAFLENAGDVGDATILHHLAALRAARVWLPGDRPTVAGATDLRLHRIMVSSGRGAAVEFRAAFSVRILPGPR